MARKKVEPRTLGAGEYQLHGDETLRVSFDTPPAVEGVPVDAEDGGDLERVAGKEAFPLSAFGDLPATIVPPRGLTLPTNSLSAPALTETRDVAGMRDLRLRPHVGAQVWFVRASGPPGTILGTEQDRFVAWVDRVYEGGSEDGRPFVDLTYHTQDERGAAFAKNIPRDPTGTKDCSWCWREGK